MELEKLEQILEAGNRYYGWGYFDSNNKFIPYGCGKKYYEGYYEYGNFLHGILNGPAIVNYGNRMVIQHFVNGKGKGWGLCLANGGLSNFGYYEEGKIIYNYASLVSWYFNMMLSWYNSANMLNMLNMYSSKETHQVTYLWIGFVFGEKILMGAKFTPDGSVWIGDTRKLEPTGFLMHFCPNGRIDVGSFEKGELVKRLSIRSYQILYINRDDLELVSTPEIEIGHNYFEGAPSNMINFADKNSTFMKYHVMQIDFQANGNFQNIEVECWEIGDKYIKTNHGNLKILDATLVNNGQFVGIPFRVNNGQSVGIQFDVNGSLSLDDFSCSKGYEPDAKIRTIAFLRQPYNAWVWTFAFNEEGRPYVAFCGYDDLDGMANFIPKLNGLYDLKK